MPAIAEFHFVRVESEYRIPFYDRRDCSSA